jgi:carotenoid cleavage dioxygenase
MSLASTADNRSDLLILDAERIEEGPIATVKMPTKVVGQVHGWWVPGDQFPKKA